MIGTVWAADTWAADTWAADTWADAVEPPPPPDAGGGPNWGKGTSQTRAAAGRYLWSLSWPTRPQTGHTPASPVGIVSVSGLSLPVRRAAPRPRQS